MKISCVFFRWNFVVWQELASIPTAPVYWEKQEACRYLTSVQREWLLYWPFTQNLEFSELSGQGGEVVSEAGDQLRRELTRGNSFLAYHFWLVFSLEMVLALSPLGVSGLPPSGHAVAAVLGVKPLSEAFQSSSVWIPLSFRHVLLVCACPLGCIVITSTPWLQGQIFILNEVYPSHSSVWWGGAQAICRR